MYCFIFNMYYLCKLNILHFMLKRITLLMSQRQLSPSQFADEIGITRAAVSHLLSGRNKPSLDMLIKILNRFEDIRSDWLLFGAGPMLKETMESTIHNQDTSVKAKRKDSSQPTLFAPDEVFTFASAGGQIKDLEPETTQERPGKEVEEIAGKSEQALPTKDAEIESIIVLYNDQSFKAYAPKK